MKAEIVLLVAEAIARSELDDLGTREIEAYVPAANAAIAALTQTAEYKELMADAERLHFWFWEGVDGFKGVPMDKYEFACEVAARNGREEPNAEDELQGFREFTDAAIDAARGEG